MTDNLSERDIFESAGPGGPEASPQPEPNPGDTVRAEQERPTPNLGQLPSDDDEGHDAEPRNDGQQASPQEAPKRGMLDDLRSERQKRQEYERQLAERDRQIAEMQGAQRQLQSMMMQFQQGQRQPSQAQPQQPAEIPDQFVDGVGFVSHYAGQAIAPVNQRLDTVETRFNRALQGMQKSLAMVQYGADEATEAENAFNTAVSRQTIHPLEWQKIQGSDNPWVSAIEWYRREKALSTTGGDPNKWFENEYQRRLREDPAFQQQTYSLLNGQAQQAAGTSVPAAGRPSPVFTGLPSLNATAGTSGQQPSGPMSESDLFLPAPPKMGGRR